MEKAVVTLYFDEVSVEVEGICSDNQKCLQMAKEKLLNQILETKKLPTILNFLVSTANVLTFENAYTGLVVEETNENNSKKKFSIVTKVNKKTVSVINEYGVNLNGIPQCFKIAENVDVKSLVKGRDPLDKNNGWKERDTAFGVINGAIVYLIVNKKTPTKTYVSIINGDRDGYILTEVQAKKLLFDTEEEAKEFYKKIKK